LGSAYFKFNTATGKVSPTDEKPEEVALEDVFKNF
jgi:hypothetical protein